LEKITGICKKKSLEVKSKGLQDNTRAATPFTEIWNLPFIRGDDYFHQGITWLVRMWSTLATVDSSSYG